MSLIDRIKKAKDKAEKLKVKSEKAKSKGKDNRSTNLERRSKNKSEKSDKLSRKFVKTRHKKFSNPPFPASSFAMGSTFGTGESMQDTAGEKTHTFKKSKSGPKDTSYKPTPAPYHGNTKDTGGKPPKSINKKNKK